MHIFITNDDSIFSPGIKSLVNLLKDRGTLTVVAPEKAMSGVGHAITMREPIAFKKVELFEGIEAYSVSGTPADCVKLGVGTLIKRKPDLLVSGINHGSNASINMIYSGTVAAAVEGALYGIPSIAFSLLNHHEEADLSLAENVVEEVMNLLPSIPFPPFSLLNVNIPNIPPEQYRGLKFCRQAMGYWREEFEEVMGNNGEKQYWLKGEFYCDDDSEETDIWALNNHFASAVPIHLDMTAYHILNKLNFIK